MAQFKREKDLARFLQCSSILEARVAKAYKHLADRVENTAAKFLLQYIMHDTSKHSEVLKGISSTIAKLEVNAKDCEETWGEVWKTLILDSIKELSQKDNITNEELASHIDAMKNLENYFAEEYLTTLHIKTVKLIAQQYDMDLCDYNTIIEWIAEDEKRHEQTLTMVKNIITKQRKPNLTKQTSHRPRKIGLGFELKKEALRETAGR
jgi:anion-transporting  ArsA/GET3 family ATPase